MNVVAHNLSAMNANRQLKINTKKMSKNSERLSSGYRINRAADDAAGLHISEKLRRQIRGLDQGLKNVSDGISWVQIGDGAMQELHEIVHRMRELAVQSSNDTNTDSDRAAIDSEIQQLKKEINRIGNNTEFNTQKVFDNSFVDMSITGTPQDIEIFNASYDDSTGDVSYGGISFRGNRISWDKINADMVTTDSNGQQIFKAGTYTYNFTDLNGRSNKFKIICEDGAAVPTLKREIDIVATSSGITIDGETITWRNLVDENGQAASSGNVHGGSWELNYKGTIISYYIPNDVATLDELADAIECCNSGEISYTWTEQYTGYKNEKAVDVVKISNLNVSNDLANQLSGSSISYTMRADDTGIWIDDGTGAVLTDSKKTWAEMGISSWDEGYDIKENKKYVYTYANSTSGHVYMSFDFNLSDVTSVDSVIDGIDGMQINATNIKTSYDADMEITLDDNINAASSSANAVLTFAEEKALGRDFDSKAVDNVASDSVQYDATTGDIVLDFKDASGSSVVQYTGSVAGEDVQMKSDLDKFVEYVLKEKTAAALEGADPQNISLGTTDLTQIVGRNNITTSGYFDTTVTIDTSNMLLSDGDNYTYYKPGVNGKTYPTAYIDFTNVITCADDLDKLIGTGFNSTCKTCTNHYSFWFVSTGGSESTTNGYQYDITKSKSNYTLQLNINSLKDKINQAVADAQAIGQDEAQAAASAFTEALIETASECYDFHYTQYAAEGGKLYVYDNRSSSKGTTDATFDTRPYDPIDCDEYSFELNTGDGRKINLNYIYDYGDFADDIVVEMATVTDGAYAKIEDGTYKSYDALMDGDRVYLADGTVGDYDSTLNANQVQRYDVSVTYQGNDTDGDNAISKQEAIESYAAAAINKMMTSTKINFDATDYTKLTLTGDENANVAVRSLFDTVLVGNEYKNGIHIQNSSEVGDYIVIPRFAMNTASLGIVSVNALTFEASQKAMSALDEAVQIISDKRSAYGAYQNRLEHIYAANANTSENAQASESRIRDANMAKEMMEYSKNMLLVQAGQSVLAQANQSEQGVLKLLQI